MPRTIPDNSAMALWPYKGLYLGTHGLNVDSTVHAFAEEIRTQSKHVPLGSLHKPPESVKCSNHGLEGALK